MKKIIIGLFLICTVVSCGENKKAEIVEQQKAIKANIKTLDDSVFVFQKDTLIETIQREKNLLIKINELQEKYDSLDLELKKY